MGSGSSKPDSTPKSQVWTAETPVRFSQGLVDSLQSSPESDSTRSKQLELHIQSRVAEELRALQDRASKDFADLQSRLSSEESQKPSSPKSEGDHLRELGREAVQNDVQQLRKKLEQRKKLSDIDERIENAKGAVVKCLRDNDRRPLDCWKEVETFKQEVRRLEGTWVEKVVR
ncbi:related to ochre suppressor tyr-tRNA [Phialocephala subalpina]|uniref:Related to ochre suppressor tyr-tRNA n=1 Tax=Phialocephala subalpina TaxID=576137 RepID=A0A1L7WG08_9HELO|nr:related to ochre suppressor tyr-tRNA [Phialocephala subalpina]